MRTISSALGTGVRCLMVAASVPLRAMRVMLEPTRSISATIRGRSSGSVSGVSR